MKGHPVFITQHATATCLRGCLQKWHRIKKGRALSEDEVRYVAALVMGWIVGQMGSS
jgi:exodeoxyribonuclease V alpha subunit